MQASARAEDDAKMKDLEANVFYVAVWTKDASAHPERFRLVVDRHGKFIVENSPAIAAFSQKGFLSLLDSPSPPRWVNYHIRAPISVKSTSRILLKVPDITDCFELELELAQLLAGPTPTSTSLRAHSINSQPVNPTVDPENSVVIDVPASPESVAKPKQGKRFPFRYTCDMKDGLAALAAVKGKARATVFAKHFPNLKSQSSFNGIARQLDKLMFQHRYHSHLIMVGGDSSDASLGEIHTTGGGLIALAHCLNLTNDNLKGIAKVLAYASEIDSSNVANGAFKIINGRLEFDERARSAEASIAIVHQIKTETSVGKRTGTDYSGMSGCERAAQSVMQADRESKKNLTVAIVREALSATSKEDLGGLDIFRAGNGFGWTVIFKRLAENNVIWLGYPMGDNVRLPRAFPAEHASRAMRQPEMEGVMVAIEARAVAGQGLRFEKREYTPGAYVIYSHDYSVPSPKGAPDSPAVIQHWRTSNGVQVPCVSGDGNMWRDIYDLSFGASSSSTSAPRIPIPLPMYGDDAKPSKANPSNSKYKTAEKGKQGNEDREDDSEEDGGI
ncbi:hypothetical protein MVEN_00320700 [Mycena venus]|uniref:Uncharacterized protein n=1 Tax=Mycena venus TaxID=2733690 RepID=A0A8H6YNS3_9AGAR|nr:hypothetical protein MVEN_00320700 [Mycena venus]